MYFAPESCRDMSSGVEESLIWIHLLCRYIPSRSNLYKWKLEKRVRSKLVSIIQARVDSKERCGYGNDLLGLMLEACHKPEGQILSRDDIVDECKTFFFAGQDTTAQFVTWTMFLLSTNQNWQEKLREEVQRECGMQTPDADMLSKLKLVNSQPVFSM